MHEASIVQGIFDLALPLMHEQQAQHIDRVWVRVGALSGVAPEALRLAFEALKEQTPAAAAELEIDLVATQLQCTACGHEFETDAAVICPLCGDWHTEVKRGRELELVRLELS